MRLCSWHVQLFIWSIIIIDFSFSVCTLAQLHDPNPSNGDNFGAAISIENELILIGSPLDDSIDTNVGQAHLFDANSRRLLLTIDDPTVTTLDNFGSAVCIDSRRLLISAPLDSSFGPLVGQVYLFDDDGKLLQTYNDPTATQSDLFGSSIAIKKNFVVVGSPGDDSLNFGNGQAHIFDALSGELLSTLNDPTGSSFDAFGSTVATDGIWVAIGDVGDDTDGFGTGQVHIFDLETGDFAFTISDPTPTLGDSFGSALAIQDGIAVISATGDDTLGENTGQVYVYNLETNDHLSTIDHPEPADHERFGTSISLQLPHLVVGAPGDSEFSDTPGKTFVFDLACNQQLASFDNSSNVADENF
ncbi:MAG: hypothetical protein AAGA30_08555 [Planctomycetota bacterium]